MKKPLRNYPELFTDTVFLIGNGSSRKDFDLNLLEGKGTIIGCNAIYRDFSPDILVCQDSKMARELKDNNYSGLVLSSKGIGVRLPNMITWKPSSGRTSGAIALRFIAIVLQPLKCYTIGMDGYPGNVYAGTQNYKVHPATKYDKFSTEYINLIKNTTVEFINVNIKSSWSNFITYKEFKKELGV
jgi:hypothetical protein